MCEKAETQVLYIKNQLFLLYTIKKL